MPTTHEWTKAGRGGLVPVADGTKNTSPQRNLPWGGRSVADKANLADRRDPWPTSSPVDGCPDGASLYGVLGLVGNASEWTASIPVGARPRALRVIRGGDWGTLESDGMHSLAVENARSPRWFSWSLGWRCAYGSTAR